MENKNNNLVFFGKNFLDKKEEPPTSAEEEFAFEWFHKHSDIFEDKHKRYFALNILNIMYYKEGWMNLEGEPNFLQNYFGEAEKRITRLFKDPKARENKVDRLKHLYDCMQKKKNKKFKIHRSKIVNEVSDDKPSVVPETEIIKLF